MFVFAILYFGVISDAGTLEPVIGAVLRAAGGRPARVVVGSALLALVVHLDGSGAVTFLVVIPAMLPLYDRLGMDRRVLACVVSLAAGVNFLPWTGPMIRASASLHIPVTQLFQPLVPVQAVGLAFVFTVAWLLGRREEKRHRHIPGLPNGPQRADRRSAPTEPAFDASLRRPRLVWVNAILTIGIIALMIAGTVEPAVMFMIGTAVALTLNYPDPAQQRQRIDAHAKAALMMAAILLAAGAFTGIMKESGMLAAMANAAVGAVPPQLAPHIPVALAIASMPLSLLFDPDSFYLGLLPVMPKWPATSAYRPCRLDRPRCSAR
jgi:citrate-Mg2+:H+ or citrate-Ca2+:H+ symporter, CitMHS family